MAAKKWKQSSPETVARFDEVMAVRGAERKILFGCPVYVLDGERYATLYQDQFVLLLSPDDGQALLKLGGKPFEPIKGRKSKGRVVLPEKIVTNTKTLKTWVGKAIEFASSH